MLSASKYLPSLLPWLLLSLLLLPSTGWSKEAAAGDSHTSAPANSQPESVAADTQLAGAIANTDVQALIELLESETARAEFLARLKALAKAQGQEAEADLAVSQLLDLETSSGALVDGYTALLNALGISDSQLGKILTTLAAVILALALVFAVRKIGRMLDAKLAPARVRFSLAPHRFHAVTGLLGHVSLAVALLLILAASAEIWRLSWFLPGAALGYPQLLNIAVVASVLALLFALIWESANAALEYAMRRSSQLSDTRIETILPIIQKILFVFLVIVFSLIGLSEMGINIMPLLAGAGVFGIALGFGAQSLVRDFLVGFTIILEDLLQIGDVVTVAGRMGKVEKITIRKLQLRSLDGTVHTIPFSGLDIIENHTKEYSYYLTDIGVAYKEDVDAVIDRIRSVSQTLRKDDTFGAMMLDDIEILGLDKFADSAIIVRARLKTRAHDKWALGREFNRRLKYAFDERGIDIPFPHRTLLLGENVGEKLQAPADQQAA